MSKQTTNTAGMGSKALHSSADVIISVDEIGDEGKCFSCGCDRRGSHRSRARAMFRVLLRGPGLGDDQMKYAMKDSHGILFSVFDADNLAAAVAEKNRVQHLHNEDWGIDDIFTVAEATPRDRWRSESRRTKAL
jgi:hypothetical protein